MAEFDPTRRAIVAGAALTGAAAVTGSAFAQGDQPSNGDAPMTQKAADFPEPPYPQQEQPWPGLAQKMNPRPDHGEESYQGSGRLKGKRCQDG